MTLFGVGISRRGHKKAIVKAIVLVVISTQTNAP